MALSKTLGGLNEVLGDMGWVNDLKEEEVRFCSLVFDMLVLDWHARMAAMGRPRQLALTGAEIEQITDGIQDEGLLGLLVERKSDEWSRFSLLKYVTVGAFVAVLGATAARFTVNLALSDVKFDSYTTHYTSFLAIRRQFHMATIPEDPLDLSNLENLQFDEDVDASRKGYFDKMLQELKRDRVIAEEALYYLDKDGTTEDRLREEYSKAEMATKFKALEEKIEFYRNEIENPGIATRLARILGRRALEKDKVAKRNAEKEQAELLEAFQHMTATSTDKLKRAIKSEIRRWSGRVDATKAALDDFTRNREEYLSRSKSVDLGMIRVGVANLLFNQNDIDTTMFDGFDETVGELLEEYTEKVYDMCMRDQNRTCLSVGETLDLWKETYDEYLKNSTRGIAVEYMELQDIVLQRHSMVTIFSYVREYLFDENHPILEWERFQIEIFLMKYVSLLPWLNKFLAGSATLLGAMTLRRKAMMSTTLPMPRAEAIKDGAQVEYDKFTPEQMTLAFFDDATLSDFYGRGDGVKKNSIRLAIGIFSHAMVEYYRLGPPNHVGLTLLSDVNGKVVPQVPLLSYTIRTVIMRAILSVTVLYPEDNPMDDGLRKSKMPAMYDPEAFRYAMDNVILKIFGVETKLDVRGDDLIISNYLQTVIRDEIRAYMDDNGGVPPKWLRLDGPVTRRQKRFNFLRYSFKDLSGQWSRVLPERISRVWQDWGTWAGDKYKIATISPFESVEADGHLMKFMNVKLIVDKEIVKPM
jgi:hypothetical protein